MDDFAMNEIEIVDMEMMTTNGDDSFLLLLLG
jgi:hypothetical protein